MNGIVFKAPVPIIALDFEEFYLIQPENYDLVNIIININHKDKFLEKYYIRTYNFNKNFITITNYLLIYKGRFAIFNINNLYIYIINTTYSTLIIIYPNYNKIRIMLQ